MVRGISGFNSVNKAKGFLLNSKVKAAGKNLELPAKIAASALGSFGIINSIKEPDVNDKFFMSCSDYDASEDYCGLDYACPIAFP